MSGTPFQSSDIQSSICRASWHMCLTSPVSQHKPAKSLMQIAHYDQPSITA